MQPSVKETQYATAARRRNHRRSNQKQQGVPEPAPQPTQQLDDGWPESVKEQGLLLLVWRHHITKQYIKAVS